MGIIGIGLRRIIGKISGNHHPNGKQRLNLCMLHDYNLDLYEPVYCLQIIIAKPVIADTTQKKWTTSV